MTTTELWEYLNSGERDFEFGYNGKTGTVCHCYLPKVYVLFDDVEIETTLDKIMSDKILDGKSLEEVVTDIELYG